MGNWQTRDRKRNKKNQDKSHKKFYGEAKTDNRVDKNVIRERRRQVELENSGEVEYE